MINQKIVSKSIIYLFIASLLFNTGVSGLISMMDLYKKPTKQSIAKVNHTTKIDAENQNNAVATNQQTDQANRNDRANNQAAQPGNSGNASLPINDTQYQILVRVIHAEAGGESLTGQVAVAAVLLNRIRSGKFPKSVSANVFRVGEFESVSNGYIWSEPTSSAFKAAKLALQG